MNKFIAFSLLAMCIATCPEISYAIIVEAQSCDCNTNEPPTEPQVLFNTDGEFSGQCLYQVCVEGGCQSALPGGQNPQGYTGIKIPVVAKCNRPAVESPYSGVYDFRLIPH